MLQNVLDPQPYLYKPSMLPDVEISLVAGIARQISIKVYAAEYKTSTLQEEQLDTSRNNFLFVPVGVSKRYN